MDNAEGAIRTQEESVFDSTNYSPWHERDEPDHEPRTFPLWFLILLHAIGFVFSAGFMLIAYAMFMEPKPRRREIDPSHFQ